MRLKHRTDLKIGGFLVLFGYSKIFSKAFFSKFLGYPKGVEENWARL